MSVFEIKSEDEAFGLLPSDLTAESVSFSGWPVLRPKIEGEDFDGSIPTRIMPEALELQKEIYRTYALAKFGKSDIRKLSRTDRRRSEIVVKVEEGSSSFIMPLIDILNWISKAKMSPQPTIVIVALTTVFGGGWYAKKIINHREEARKLVSLSQEETKPARIIAEMAKENVVRKESLDRYKTPFEHVTRSLDPEDTLSVNDQEIIDGKTARQLFRARPETIEEVRLDGFFVILWVSSGAQRDGYRAWVRREDGLETLIDIPSTAISSDEKSILQKSEWEKKSLYMRINARMRRREIVSAKLIQAGMEDRSKTNPQVAVS